MVALVCQKGMIFYSSWWSLAYTLKQLWTVSNINCSKCLAECETEFLYFCSKIFYTPSFLYQCREKLSIDNDNYSRDIFKCKFDVLNKEDMKLGDRR